MPIIDETPPWNPCSRFKCWFDLVVVGGVLSASSFLLFETALSWTLTRRPFVPLRLFATPILGLNAVAVSYPRVPAILVGLLVLLSLSVLSAYALAAFLSHFPALARSMTSILATSSALGYVSWVVSYLLMSRAVSAGLDPNLEPALHGFIGHVFFYGLTLGYYIAKRQERGTITNVRFRL